jgi:hypothetical protein
MPHVKTSTDQITGHETVNAPEQASIPGRVRKPNVLACSDRIPDEHGL